jgi:hypothetical protein
MTAPARPAMPFHDTPLFEFNRFTPWELFTSAYRMSREAESAKSPMHRLHFNRAMLLFAFAAIEATANYTVQRLATAAGDSKETFIKRNPVEDKLDYIEAKTDQRIERTEFDKLQDQYRFLRNEIAHPKRADQQEQFHVQHTQPLKFLRLLQVFFVRCFHASDGEFPYWITGWNYTGFNGNWRDLFLSYNGFSHSLGRMQFPFKPNAGLGTIEFANAHMATLEHFHVLQEFLDRYPQEVEPMSPGFPDRPRLIRCWWLSGVLDAVEQEVFVAKGWRKPE